MHGSDPMTKPWVFKDHISAGLMMAFLGYLAMALATAVRKGIGRWLLYLVAVLAMVNVLFVLQGRTGQVVAIAYMVVFVAVQLHEIAGQRHGARAGSRQLRALRYACASWAVPFTAKHSRLAETGQEIKEFEVYNQNTSMGVRLEFYQRSLELIRATTDFRLWRGQRSHRIRKAREEQHGWSRGHGRQSP